MQIYLDNLRQGGFVSGTPHSSAIGMELVEVEPGRGTIKCAWREDLVGDADTGVIAGGVVTALLDHVCGLATMAALSEPGMLATLDLRIDYLRPAEPRRDVYASAHCYKMTRTVAFVRASAHDGDPDHPVATAQGTFILNPAKEAGA